MKRFPVFLALLFFCCACSREAQKPVETALPEPSKSNAETSVPESSPKAGERIVLTADGVEYAFRWCPPGEFMMGAEKFSWEKPIHKVKLTKGFWMLETEVTQAMWQSVMGKNPSRFRGEKNPVENVTWDECQEFCTKLSQMLGQQVQLPTEAQWEYACRAGTTTDYCWGDDASLLYLYGKYSEKSDLSGINWQSSTPNNSYNRTVSVGIYKPNDWGLYDMHGNVDEFCSDYYDEEYYARSPVNDPENTTESPYRVHRGGSWFTEASYCRSSFRLWVTPGFYGDDLGLRVLLVPSQEK